MAPIARPLVVFTLRKDIKALKTALEDTGLFDKGRGVTICSADDICSGLTFEILSSGTDWIAEEDSLGVLWTSDSVLGGARDEDSAERAEDLEERLRRSFDERGQDVPLFAVALAGTQDEPLTKSAAPTHDLRSCVKEWLLHERQTSILNALAETVTVEDLIAEIPSTYTRYGVLLLLSPRFLQTPNWSQIAVPQSCRQELGRLIARRFDVSHVAINAPIPLSLETDNNGFHDDNPKRLPAKIEPLYGAFGVLEFPSSEAFARAFWTSTSQHGITQIWAPLYTMFSRGNVKEKARILDLDLSDEGEMSVVDLYAGIGYFALCFAKHPSVKKVLCWEINDWSVEGFRRGALANRWTVDVLRHDQERLDAKLMMFSESNEFASPRVSRLRSRIPPVRYVNCGYLPTSEPSWKTAVEVLDPELGGTVNAHENVAIYDIEGRAKEVQVVFSRLVADLDVKQQVSIESVQTVKSYAPGVMHCVFVVAITPKPI